MHVRLQFVKSANARRVHINIGLDDCWVGDWITDHLALAPQLHSPWPTPYNATKALIVFRGVIPDQMGELASQVGAASSQDNTEVL